MSRQLTSIVAIAALALVLTTQTTEAFTPTVFVPKTYFSLTTRYAEETKEAAFMPAESADDDEDGEDTLASVEMLGRGAAKVR